MDPPVAGGADSSGSKVRLECKNGQQHGRAVHAFASVGAGTRGGASSHPPFVKGAETGFVRKASEREATSGRAGGDHSPIPSISPEQLRPLSLRQLPINNPLLLAAPTRTGSERERVL
jgi:hypothetical protein